ALPSPKVLTPCARAVGSARHLVASCGDRARSATEPTICSGGARLRDTPMGTDQSGDADDVNLPFPSVGETGHADPCVWPTVGGGLLWPARFALADRGSVVMNRDMEQRRWKQGPRILGSRSIRNKRREKPPGKDQ